jgi:4-diphosphocytidyl-2-C-methyl-D-erythritol kinase
MVSFPHAKINLGLQVVKKRHDGLHNIISCLYPIHWCDVLEILKASEMKLTCTGIDIPGDIQDNLCLKAYYLLKQQFELPPVHIHLHKAIPMGAGLGGGSSDAAFTLKMLRQLFDLPLSVLKLQQLAGKLGNDCPFFITSQVAMATGTGNILEPIPFNMEKYYLVVVTPPVHVNTARAYSLLDPKPPETDLRQFLNHPITDWQSGIKNDFEQPIFSQYPDIARIKHILISNGAVFASLSGSGSSVFGIFKEEQNPKDWFSKDHEVWVQDL